MVFEGDANLFSMIHSLLDEQDPPHATDRRAGDRRPFACEQLLAPYDGRALPKQAEFRLVQCRDLSPSGFSFFWPHPPDYEHVVIALGAVPFTFFLAQVIHAEASLLRPENRCLVGCRFLNRIA